MLRRLKQDVDLAIPPKKEVLVYAPMSKIQTEFYEGTVNRTIFKMIEEKNVNFPFMVSVIYLICYLIDANLLFYLHML